MEMKRAEAARWWSALRWLDWVGLGLLSFAIVALCVVRSRSRLFWSDELFSFTLLRDPALSHTLRGWWEGSDSGGLLYYLTGWVWFRVFGASALTLRLLSTVGFLVAIAVIWAMARRYFTTLVVGTVTTAVFLLPIYLVWQEGNGRFYGMFLASAAFASACTMAAVEQGGRPTRRLLVLTCCAHGCLIASHMLGMVYSAGLLGALVVSDVLEGRRRLSLYAGVVVAWVAVVALSFHSIRATATTAQGVFWTVRPHLMDLVWGFFAYNRKLAATAELLLIALVVRYEVWGTAAAAAPRRSHRPVAVVIDGLVLAQLAIFAKSRVGVSIYSDRYLLPMTIAVVLLLCEGLTRVLGAGWLRRLSRPAPTLVLLVATVVVGTGYALRPNRFATLYAAPGYPEKMEALLPPGHVVVVTFVPTFMMLQALDPGHRYVFLTDWGYDGRQAGADLSGQRVMESMARGGFAAGRVLDLPEILRQTPEFTLLTEPGRLPWLRDRLERSGDFAVTEVGSLGDWYPVTVWRVRCLHPESGCRPGGEPAGKKAGV